MFWNDPNLYSVAFKDIPQIPFSPFGTIPRYNQPFPMTPSYFMPPVTPFTPFLHTPNVPFQPFLQTPNIPFTPFLQAPNVPFVPYLHTQAYTPFINPMTPPTMNAPFTPYNWTLPFYGAYRPFPL